ncbi:hypothetical protein Save01_06342 [Streptomyces avermitilis]
MELSLPLGHAHGPRPAEPGRPLLNVSPPAPNPPGRSTPSRAGSNPPRKAHQ